LLGEESKESGTVRVVWRRRKWLALASLALPLSVAVGTAAFLPDLFRSTALVIVEHERVPGFPVAQAVPSELDTRLQILNQENLSRSRLRELITRFDLYPELRRQASLEAAIDRLRRDVKVEIKDVEQTWGRATVAFALSYRGRDPQTVAQVTNALASFYVEQSLRQRERQTSGAVQLLKAQLEEMKTRLAAEEKRLTEYKTQHLRELPEQVKVNLAMLERLNNQLAANRESQNRARADREGSESNRLDGPGTQLDRLQKELRELRTRVTDQHPDVVRLKVEIASLAGHSSPAALPSGKPVDRPRPELRALEDEEQRLKQAIAEYEEKVYNAPKQEQELERLLPPYEAAKARYQTLLSRLEDAQLAESLERREGSDPFRIVDPAVAAKQPTAPDRWRLLVAGLILSLGLAVAAVLLAERLDSSFHTLDELRSLTRVPVLVSVPNIFTPDDAARSHRRVLFAAAVAALALAASIGGTYAIAHENESLVSMLAAHGHA